MINSISLSGRLGNEIKKIENEYTDNQGQKRIFTTALFSIAQNHKVKADNEKGYDLVPRWFNCKATGRNAENLIKFFNKGDGITVQGVLNYYDKTLEGESKPRSYFFVDVKDWDFGSKKQKEPEQWYDANNNNFDDPPF